MILLFVSVSGCPGTGKRKEDAHICGTARLFFTLCPAYIKHALLLQLEQKGKQCHQVKFLRIPQTPQQTDLSPYQTNGSRRRDFSSVNFNKWYLFIQNKRFFHQFYPTYRLKSVIKMYSVHLHIFSTRHSSNLYPGWEY